MTPGEVRVTVALVCPAGCRGGVDYETELSPDDDRWFSSRLVKCSTCHGRGVVDEPVTCGDCAHSAHAEPNLLCDLLRCRVHPGFACQSWAPLMVVSEPRS